MAVAGHIVANLTTNTTGWSGGLNAALGPLSNFASSAFSLAASAVQRFSEVGDALQKMSVRTGATVEELGRLKYAAGLSDTSLEAVQTGLMRMNKFLLETANGSKGAATTLQGLGLSMTQLNDAEAAERFGMFADALNGVQDPGERAAIAMKIFGKQAADLLPLLNEGSSGMKIMGDRAERLGQVMGNAAASQAAALNDAWGEMVSSVDALVVAFGSEFAPVVVGLAKVTSEWLADNREMVITLGKLGVTVLALVGAFKLYSEAVQIAGKAQAIAQALSGPKGWITLAGGLIGTALVMKTVDSVFGEVSKSGTELLENARKTKEAFAAQNSETKKTAEANHELVAAMSQLRNTYDSLIPAHQQVKNDIADMAKNWHAANKAGQSMTLTFDQMKEAQARMLLKESGFSSMFDGLTSELAVLRGEITETEQQFAEMAAFGVDTKHLDKLREMMQERDKLLSEQAKEEKAKEEAANRIADVTSRVQESQTSPLSRFAEEVRAVEEAVASGSILATSGLTYLEQLREQMLKDAEGDAAKVEQRGQASNVGLDARSAQANQAIVDLVNRRGASPEQTALAEQKKATALAEQSKSLLTDIRDETRRRSLPTRPFGQRS